MNPHTSPPPSRRESRASYGLVLLILPLVGLLAAVIIVLTQGDDTASEQAAGDGFATPPPVTFIPPTPVPTVAATVPAGSVVGSPVPDFTLTTLDGETLSLAALEDRILFINFWATWCEPCEREMPALQALQEGFPPERVRVIGITDPTASQTEAQIRDFLDTYAITFPVVLSSELALYQAFNVLQIPVTYIVDEAGIVRFRHLGELHPDDIQSYLNRLIE